MLRFACWNIRSWNKRDQEIIIELNNHKIDICALSETRRKGKGTTQYENYMLIYSGKEKTDKATNSGVGLLISEKFIPHITNVKYINDRILTATLNIEKTLTHFIATYAPDASKPTEEYVAFCDQIQDELDSIPSQDRIILMGDLNARVGNEILDRVKEKFNEDVINDRGEMLIDLCARNELRINNTFYQHKPQHTYTWSDTRGRKSVIDYIITNKNIHPKNILDVRVLSSANIGSDHGLVLSKIRLRRPPLVKIQPEYKEKTNIEALENESTKILYQNRLDQKIQENQITLYDNVEQCWEKLKNNILRASKEAVGTRKININNKKVNKPWFTEEVKVICKEKRDAYLKYRSQTTPEEHVNYIETRNRVNARIRAIKEEHWERFAKDTEHDFYGSQKRVWKLLRSTKRPINENIQINSIKIEECTKYFKNLYNSDENNTQDKTETQGSNWIITENHVENTIRELKNRKAPGENTITNEQIKYGGPRLIKEITKTFNRIIEEEKVPQEWNKSMTTLLFKKGDKKNPSNYRGISLLDTISKIFTRIIAEDLRATIPICEEQQGFRKNRSTTDAIFIIRQIVEKSIEYNNPAFMCFVDLTKAFDKIKLSDIVRLLKEKNVSSKLIRIIEELNYNCSTKIKLEGKVSEKIKINTGIRQGDSLSPFLFNLVMDEIIGKVNTLTGYKIGNKNITIVCYADDAVLISNSEDNLQRMLQTFNKIAKEYNMVISIGKTECLTISKEPLRCKLEIEGKIINQVMSSKYLGVDVTSHRDIYQETTKQVKKAATTAGALRDIVWRNRHLALETKTRIYKTCIRPILTYAIETRADTKKTKQALRTAEMKTLRSIVGKTRLDRVRNEDVRQQCNIQDIVRWGRERRRNWNRHVTRMEEHRLAKITRDFKPEGKRSQGRPQKRWQDSWSSESQIRLNIAQ